MKGMTATAGSHCSDKGLPGGYNHDAKHQHTDQTLEPSMGQCNLFLFLSFFACRVYVVVPVLCP